MWPIGMPRLQDVLPRLVKPGQSTTLRGFTASYNQAERFEGAVQELLHARRRGVGRETVVTYKFKSPALGVTKSCKFLQSPPSLGKGTHELYRPRG